MLLFVRSSTRIRHEPCLIASIESASGRRVAAAVRHDATDYHSLNKTLRQLITQLRVDEGIVGILGDDAVVLRYFRYLRYQLPVLTAGGYGAVGSPFADELVLVGWGEGFIGVPVLHEYEREGGGLEVGTQFEDVGKGGDGHVKEYMLHIYDE